MATRSQSCLSDQLAQAGVRDWLEFALKRHLLKPGSAYSKIGQNALEDGTIFVCPVPYRVPSGGQVRKYGGQLVIAHYVDGLRLRPIFTNLWLQYFSNLS